MPHRAGARLPGRPATHDRHAARDRRTRGSGTVWHRYRLHRPGRSLHRRAWHCRSAARMAGRRNRGGAFGSLPRSGGHGERCRAAGLGEAVRGAGRGKRRFLYVTVGTGIGVAIILDGTLYRGVDGSHPEIGHQVIDASGPPCYCGARGCWEIRASGPAILAWAQTHIAPDHPGNGELTMKRLCELADAGDPAALAVMDRQGYYLGLGLANLVTTFCPDTIALGGGVIGSSHLFLDRARQVI